MLRSLSRQTKLHTLSKPPCRGCVLCDIGCYPLRSHRIHNFGLVVSLFSTYCDGIGHIFSTNASAIHTHTRTTHTHILDKGRNTLTHTHTHRHTQTRYRQRRATHNIDKVVGQLDSQAVWADISCDISRPHPPTHPKSHLLHLRSKKRPLIIVSSNHWETIIILD